MYENAKNGSEMKGIQKKNLERNLWQRVVEIETAVKKNLLKCELSCGARVAELWTIVPEFTGSNPTKHFLQFS